MNGTAPSRYQLSLKNSVPRKRARLNLHYAAFVASMRGVVGYRLTLVDAGSGLQEGDFPRFHSDPTFGIRHQRANRGIDQGRAQPELPEAGPVLARRFHHVPSVRTKATSRKGTASSR